MKPRVSRWSGKIAVRVLVVLAILLGASPIPARSASAAGGAPADQLVDGINQARSQAGLAPLEEAWALDSVATDRSVDMVVRQYFSHTNPDGQNVFDILDARGIGFYTAGENLHRNTVGPAQAGTFALRSFMASPPHRANILNGSFSRLGVGVANDGGWTIFTVVFLG